MAEIKNNRIFTTLRVEGSGAPGLLLSLGDGTAVEVTDEQMVEILRVYSGLRVTAADGRNILKAFIQQAQEARDAG